MVLDGIVLVVGIVLDRDSTGWDSISSDDIRSGYWIGWCEIG